MLVQISLNLITTTGVNYFPAHNTPGISLSVPGWSKLTSDTMNSRSDDYDDLINPLAQHNNIHGFAAFRVGDRNCFVLHGIMNYLVLSTNSM